MTWSQDVPMPANWGMPRQKRGSVIRPVAACQNEELFSSLSIHGTAMVPNAASQSNCTAKKPDCRGLAYPSAAAGEGLPVVGGLHWRLACRHICNNIAVLLVKFTGALWVQLFCLHQHRSDPGQGPSPTKTNYSIDQQTILGNPGL